MCNERRRAGAEACVDESAHHLWTPTRRSDSEVWRCVTRRSEVCVFITAETLLCVFITCACACAAYLRGNGVILRGRKPVSSG